MEQEWGSNPLDQDAKEDHAVALVVEDDPVLDPAGDQDHDLEDDPGLDPENDQVGDQDPGIESLNLDHALELVLDLDPAPGHAPDPALDQDHDKHTQKPVLCHYVLFNFPVFFCVIFFCVGYHKIINLDRQD